MAKRPPRRTLCSRSVPLPAEYAVRVRQHCQFVCLDDKHRVKVGEPNFPVAAAERGRRVLTAAGSQFMVGDHDFIVTIIYAGLQTA